MRGCSLVVKPQFSKLMMRVRFPSSPPLKSVLVSTETETLFFFARVSAVDQMLLRPRTGAAAEALDPSGSPNLVFREMLVWLFRAVDEFQTSGRRAISRNMFIPHRLFLH